MHQYCFRSFALWTLSGSWARLRVRSEIILERCLRFQRQQSRRDATASGFAFVPHPCRMRTQGCRPIPPRTDRAFCQALMALSGRVVWLRCVSPSPPNSAQRWRLNEYFQISETEIEHLLDEPVIEYESSEFDTLCSSRSAVPDSDRCTRAKLRASAKQRRLSAWVQPQNHSRL